MVKKQTKFLIVLLYIAVTLIGLEIAIRNPENLLIVIGGFLIVIGVLTMLVAYTIHTVLKKYADKEREYMENIANSINAMVILWYDDFKHVKVNTVFTKKFGYSSEEMLDMDTLKQILPPDAFAVSLQAIVNNRDEEFIATAKDGSKIHTIWNTSLMKTIYVNERQTCLMLSIGLDLTENSALREEILKYSKDLRDSEDKFSMSMEFSEIGLILRDENSFYVSDQFKKMVVYDEKDGETVADTLNKSVHPKDKHVINSVIKDMGDVDDKDYNRIRSVELRLLRQDNLYHWFQFRYKVTPDSDFKKARIGGAVIDVTNDREKDQLIEQMAYIDEVTEIYNRNRFIMLGEEIYNTSYKEMGFDHWIIVFDIDNFHIINDTCGYLSGNKLLKEFARVLLFALIDEGICARIGGDNFAVIIEVGDDEQRPVKLINTVQKNLSKLAIDNFSTQNLSCSAGYSKMSNGSKNFIQGLDHAEFSLSLSDGKRGDIIQYDEMIHTKILQSTELEKELAKAIDHNDLVLYYQPKINLANGELIGMEALIRWIKPDGSIIPPGQFIPIAENSLLITKISEFVLEDACRQNKAWQDAGYPKITVSVNLSAIDFYQTNVTDSIKLALSHSGLEAEYLDVELTESLALKDIDHAIHQMEEIKALGVKLSMDDFGTGYSSLSYLQVLPITLLKLDRSFVMYLEEDEISREILAAVIRIAKSKKIETIAEGIETVEQASILKASGCDHAQGYFFGKPMTAEDFEKFMQIKMDEAAAKGAPYTNVSVGT